jgi:hypothetical protein
MTCSFRYCDIETVDGMAKRISDKYGTDVYDVREFGDAIGKAVAGARSAVDLRIKQLNDAAATAGTDAVRLAQNGNAATEIYGFVIHRRLSLSLADDWAPIKAWLSKEVVEMDLADAAVLAARMSLLTANTPDEVAELAAEAVEAERKRLVQIDRLDDAMYTIANREE